MEVCCDHQCHAENKRRMHSPNPSEKLDMGNGCLRYKKLEDLPLDTRGSASGSGTGQRTRMSHAKRNAGLARTVGAACALLFLQRRSRDNRPVGRTARCEWSRRDACDIDGLSRLAEMS